jgi:hypothetical protein
VPTLICTINAPHGKAPLINKLALSNLAHRPVRAVLSVLAIAVEVAMILTLVGVSFGTLDGTARRTRGVGADLMIRPPRSAHVNGGAPAYLTQSQQLRKLLNGSPDSAVGGL